jgi:hypothetical protein
MRRRHSGEWFNRDKRCMTDNSTEIDGIAVPDIAARPAAAGMIASASCCRLRRCFVSLLFTSSGVAKSDAWGNLHAA